MKRTKERGQRLSEHYRQDRKGLSSTKTFEKTRPLIWMVDDLELNRKEFEEKHAKYFEIRTFKEPIEVMMALESEVPDALVCDLFFYPEEEGRKIEEEVKKQTQPIADYGREIDIANHADGIELAERVRQHYGGRPPFPIFAYTSKSAYLLDDPGFERVEDAKMRWLFKKYGDVRQRMIIHEEIQKHMGSKVFIVHGHDEDLLTHLRSFLTEDMGLEPIVLRDEPGQGQTIIEKFERHSDVHYAVVLLTRDIERKTGQALPRPNVLFELGYFFGRLGRDRVCILFDKKTQIPSDVIGVDYTEIDLKHEWKDKLKKELEAAWQRKLNAKSPRLPFNSLGSSS